MIKDPPCFKGPYSWDPYYNPYQGEWFINDGSGLSQKSYWFNEEGATQFNNVFIAWGIITLIMGTYQFTCCVCKLDMLQAPQQISQFKMPK